MFLPGGSCGCCKTARCPLCSVAPSKAIITFSRNSGGGVVYDDEPGNVLSVECEGGSHTFIVDMEMQAACSVGGRPGVNFLSDIFKQTETGPEQLNEVVYGGEGVSAATVFNFTGNQRDLGLGGWWPGAFLFEGEALWGATNSAWFGGVSPWAPGFPHSRIGAEQEVRKLYVWQLRDREPPTFDLHLQSSSGSGAEFEVNLSQHADTRGAPYWKVPSVTVKNGGDGYTTADMDLQLVSVITNNALDQRSGVPEVYVHSAIPKRPTVYVSVETPYNTGAAAVLSVTLKEIPRSVVPGLYIFRLSYYSYLGLYPYSEVEFEYTCVDSITLVSGGSGYPPNSKLQLRAASPYNGAADLRWFAETNAAGVITGLSMAAAPEISNDVLIQKRWDDFLYGRGQFAPYFQITGVLVRYPGAVFTGLSETQVIRTREAPPLPEANLFSVTLTQTGQGDMVFWSLSSVAVTAGAGNTDWQVGGVFGFSWPAADEVVVEVAPQVTVSADRVEPELTLNPPAGGSGASLDFTLAPNGSDPPTWRIEAVSVLNGGAGYTDGSKLSVTRAAGSFNDSQYLDIQAVTGRIEPTLTAHDLSDTGDGAVLTPVLEQTPPYFSWKFWYVSSVTINNGGSGYAVGDLVNVNVFDGKAGPNFVFSAEVSEVDQGGAIVAITINDGGEFWKDSGVIESVEVIDGGQYYKSRLLSVVVTQPGKFYRQFFQTTNTPINPADCLTKPPHESYTSAGPNVGDEYVTGGFLVGGFGVSANITRRCEHANISVTFE